MTKKTFKKAAIGFIIFLISAFLLIFVFRTSLLHFAIAKYQKKFEASHNAFVSIKESGFADLNSIYLKNVVIAPAGRDTFLSIQTIFAGLDFFNLLTGNIRFHKLEINDVSIHVFEKDSLNNYDFLYKRKGHRRSDPGVNKKAYSSKLNSIINSFFENTPTLINIIGIHLNIVRNDQNFNLYIPAFHVKNMQVSALIIDESEKKENTWAVNGFIDQRKEKFQLKVYFLTKNKVELPFLYNRYGLKTSFDTLNFTLDNKEFSDNLLVLGGSATVSNLFINHKRLSPNDIVLKHVELNYNLMLDENSFQLDSLSRVVVNKITFQPFLKYTKKDSVEKDIVLKIRTGNLPSQNFFESLPTGMFENLEGIKTEGELNYKLDFHINTLIPDSLQFKSLLSKEHFKIIKYGNAYLPKINEPFSYTAYEGGKAVKTFVVGPANPDFTPYEEISDYLKYALLTSEDGNFFYHSGFNEEAFAKSIATNFKLGKFARGGSTISMQLVKNVFLTRNKTITRKLEEALIVWLIENNHLAAKQRMYEVYLNIIEWGPGVYGIKEASRFYFDKLPSSLNLSESIFLASIVPSPKAFKYSFDKEGHLRGYLEGYFKLVASRLLRKNIITEEEFEKLETNVVLNGKARLLVTPSDTTSTFILDEEDLLK
jgi:hypothetical protein